MSLCNCSGVRKQNNSKHVYSACCPIADCLYESDYQDTLNQIVRDLTVHLWSTHDEEDLASYIANMLREDPYDSHDDSRPYYLMKHVLTN